MKHKKNNLREHKINFEIKSEFVFLIDQNGDKIGSVLTYKAKGMAQDAGMDLVQVAENKSTPVCKIMNYGKFLFDEKKNKSKAKKEKKVNEKKEIQVRPLIEENDYQVKIRRALSFLKTGYKVNFVLKLRGRQNAHPEVGFSLLRKVIEDTKEYSKADFVPKIESKRCSMLLTPIEKKEIEVKVD